MADERLETSQFGVLQLYHAPIVSLTGVRQGGIDKISLLITDGGSSPVHVITLCSARADRFSFWKESGLAIRTLFGTVELQLYFG